VQLFTNIVTEVALVASEAGRLYLEWHGDGADGALIFAL
jgi:hypothetical protein